MCQNTPGPLNRVHKPWTSALKSMGPGSPVPRQVETFLEGSYQCSHCGLPLTSRTLHLGALSDAPCFIWLTPSHAQPPDPSCPPELLPLDLTHTLDLPQTMMGKTVSSPVIKLAKKKSRQAKKQTVEDDSIEFWTCSWMTDPQTVIKWESILLFLLY